jgi:hypothetical protein
VLPTTVSVRHIFHSKSTHFVTAKSDQDPDLHGSDWLAPWIRICFEVEVDPETNADPQHCYKEQETLKLCFEAWVHPPSFDFGLLRPGGEFDGTDSM